MSYHDQARRDRRRLAPELQISLSQLSANNNSVCPVAHFRVRESSWLDKRATPAAKRAATVTVQRRARDDHGLSPSRRLMASPTPAPAVSPPTPQQLQVQQVQQVLQAIDETKKLMRLREEREAERREQQMREEEEEKEREREEKKMMMREQEERKERKEKMGKEVNDAEEREETDSAAYPAVHAYDMSVPELEQCLEGLEHELYEVENARDELMAALEDVDARISDLADQKSLLRALAKIRRENERLSQEADRAQRRKIEADEAIERERRELDESAARTRRELDDARERVRLEAEELAAQRALQAAEHERIKEARVELKQLDAKKKEAEELASELESRKAAADELRARLEEAETELAADRDQLDEERQALAEEKLKMAGLQEFASRRVKLNVGGAYFQTSLTTLTQVPSMFSAMFSGKYLMEDDEEGCYFIDRDPTHFRYVLNFLRDSRVEVPTTEGNESFVRELLAEAEFYQVEGLISLLSDILGGASADDRSFSPRSPSSSHSLALQFSGSSTAKRSGTSGAIGASTVPSTTTRIHTRPTMP